MNPDVPPTASDRMPDLDQTAEITMTAGPLTVNMKARATPAGLLAVGGLVGCILLSTAVLVWTATSVKRKRTIAAALGR